MPQSLSIGDLAHSTDVPASTLRYYESLGLLPEPPRIGGKRRYPPQSIARVRAVRTATGLGFSLAEVRQLQQVLRQDGAAGTDAKAVARRKIAELDDQIARARAMKQLLQRSLACEDEHPEGCACPAQALEGLAASVQAPS
jgi:DNA-binding transcriptional MerR regulator